MYQKPRGTYDLIGNEMRFFEAVINDLKTIAKIYGFSEIKTPIFESTDLFIRAVGTDSDIVNKEMYTFEDKKGRSLTLRPELTAPIIRSYIENKLYASGESIHKLFSVAEAFRYERQQAGRYRQFHQFSIEAIGSDDISIDVEVIMLAHQIVSQFDLLDNVKLQINTIATSEERKQYTQQLETYFSQYESDLCSDCQRRLKTNPLRILDCKADANKQFVQKAPLLFDSISQTAKERFEKVCKSLDDLNIEYEINQRLVRGLDYYNDTVFEYVIDSEKSQNALLGGGRYNSLVGMMHKEKVPAFGLGLGIERLILLLKEKNQESIETMTKQLDVYYIPLVEDAKLVALKSMSKLRQAGIACEMNTELKSIKSQLKQADKLKSVYAVIIGEKELLEQKVIIRNMATKEQAEVSLEDFEMDLIPKGDENEHI